MTSATEARDNDVMATWTRELNASLHPLGVLLSGVDAASVLPSGFAASPLEAFRMLSEDDLSAIARAANEYCETNQIEAEHIRSAVARTLWHWSEA